MRELFSAVLVMSAAGTGAYALTRLLAALGGDRLSQTWRYNAALLSAALFVLPLHRLWDLVPRRIVALAPLSGICPAAAPAADAGAFPKIAAVWLAVAAALTVWDLRSLLRTSRALRLGAVPAAGAISALAREEALGLGVRAMPEILISPLVPGPVLVGFFRPVILLPPRALPSDQTRLILRHELIHFRRLDLWRKLALNVLRRVHWFNPVAYIMCRDAAFTAETSCDEQVAVTLNNAQRRQYGYLLIDCAPIRPGPAGSYVSFAPCRAKLERRISTMMNTKKKSAVVGVILALVLLAGCLAVSALAAGTEDPETPVFPDFDDMEPVYSVTVNVNGENMQVEGRTFTIDPSAITPVDPDSDEGMLYYSVDVDGSGEQTCGTVHYDLSGVFDN